MEIGDVQFRVGLIVAVIFLGSAFAGGLYLLIGKNEDEDAARTAETMGNAIEALMSGSSSGTLTLEIGSGNGDGIGIRPTLGGEPFMIHVLPSLIYLDWKEGREVISRAKGILPTYMPFCKEGEATPLQGLGEICTGFESVTPCTLIVDLLVFNGSSFLLVHPPTSTWMDEITIFGEFLADGSIPAPGKVAQRTVIGTGPIRTYERWLIFYEKEGSCPYPIRIPEGYDSFLPAEPEEITARVRCYVSPGGTLEISRTLS